MRLVSNIAALTGLLAVLFTFSQTAAQDVAISTQFIVENPDIHTSYGGVDFPAGTISFVDRVVSYEPDFGGGPIPDATSMDARQILGVPDTGGVSLGNGGRIRLRFIDNSLTGSDDSRPDLWIFEVGSPETVYVDISKDGRQWRSVGTATGFAYGIDIDEFGFGSADRFAHVRITDDGDSPGGEPFTQGGDLVAVGASSSAAPVTSTWPTGYKIQAQVSGQSELIIQKHMMQWHHIRGIAPGLAHAHLGTESNAPTIVDSNLGPNMAWVPSGWPDVIGNGTHPESYSNVFDSLAPPLPDRGRCWRLEKIWGEGSVKITQQPDASNGHSLVVRFDDLGPGAIYRLTGSGFYVIKLQERHRECAFYD